MIHSGSSKDDIRKYIIHTYKYLVREKDGLTNIDMSSILPSIDKVVDIIDEDRDRSGFVLCGNTGIGKSILAEAARRVMSQMYGSIPKLKYNEMISSVHNTEGYYKSNMHMSHNLMIDDVGAEKEVYKDYGENEKPFITIVLDRDELPQGITIITSNIMPNKIRERYGDRVLDRLKRVCKFIKVEGESFR